MRVLLACTLALAGCAPPIANAGRAEVEFFRRPGSTAPFSPAVRAGDTLYVSGAIGMRPDGTVPDGFEAQARQAMDNLGSSLELAGRSFDDVVKCTVMLEDMADWPAFNRVYRSYFRADRLPARSALGVDGLALGSKVEVECIAHVPADRGGR